MINFKIVIIWIDVTIFPWLTHCLKWACLTASRDFFENHAIYTILYKLNYKQQPGRWHYNPTLCEALQSNPCIRSLLFVLHLSHTCGVYNPCDKPYLYQTGDDLSNTSGPTYFWHSPTLQLLNDLFLNFSLYILHLLFLLPKNWFKKSFVEDLNVRRKTHTCVVNENGETANDIRHQGIP